MLKCMLISKTRLTIVLYIIVIVTQPSKWTKDIAWSHTWCEAMFFTLDEKAASISHLRDMLDEMRHDTQTVAERSEKMSVEAAREIIGDEITAVEKTPPSTVTSSSRASAVSDSVPKVSEAADYDTIQLVEYCIGASTALVNPEWPQGTASEPPEVLGKLLGRFEAVKSLFESAKRDSNWVEDKAQVFKSGLECCWTTLNKLRKLFNINCLEQDANRATRFRRDVAPVFRGKDCELQILWRTLENDLNGLEGEGMFVIGDKLMGLRYAVHALASDDNGGSHLHGESNQLAVTSARKRKIDDDTDKEHSSAPLSLSSLSLSSPSLVQPSTQRTIKRTRTNTSAGRPLPLPRLLQTLSSEELRNLVQNISDERPEVCEIVFANSPRPSVNSVITVLAKYEDDFQQAFPLGCRSTSDYAYNRVRPKLIQLIEALRDYTPCYLPPRESQLRLSLVYLDAITSIVHRVPDWETHEPQRYKKEAYDEIGFAWAHVLEWHFKTSAQTATILQLGSWSQKLSEHNSKSGGNLAKALTLLQGAATGHMQSGTNDRGGPQSTAADQRALIRQQLLSGTYGATGPDGSSVQ